MPAERPKASGLSTFADPASGRFWPARTQSAYGRAVAFRGADGGAYGGGTGADPTAQRYFLSPHDGAQGRWLNAGIDLYADFGDVVVAAEQGVIASFEQDHGVDDRQAQALIQVKGQPCGLRDPIDRTPWRRGEEAFLPRRHGRRRHRLHARRTRPTPRQSAPMAPAVSGCW